MSLVLVSIHGAVVSPSPPLGGGGGGDSVAAFYAFMMSLVLGVTLI